VSKDRLFNQFLILMFFKVNLIRQVQLIFENFTDTKYIRLLK